jgi:hypothetical protein
MLTTLSIVSLNQGKITPRFDQEPITAEEWAELQEPKAVARAPRISLFIFSTLAGILTPTHRRKPGKLNHA